MKKKTFQIGGIHPEENKISSDIVVENFPLTKQATVFLHQNLGAPSTVKVNKGDKILVGQLLGKAEKFVCANVHSPFSGTVKSIEDIADASGYKKQAVVIDVEGDEWADYIDRTPDINKEITLSKQEIIDRIKECGIVGLGGACFPVHIKYMLPPEIKIDFLLVNAAECEPYITVDHRMMLERAEQCLVGIQALLIASGAPKALIGIEANKKDAIAYLQELCKQYDNIEVIPLKTKYPQGAEKQLIKALTGRSVPNGKLPSEVGVIVNNITTTFAVYEAVQKHKPLIETYLTISGKTLKVCKNYKVRIGTPIREILDSIEIPDTIGKVISGGPMMGKAIANLDTFTVKGMSSLLLLDEKESKRGAEHNCLRCGKCVSACPMGLEPYLFYFLVQKQDWESCEKYGIMNCCECGSCSFGCPANRSILDYIRVGKNKTGAMIRNKQK